MAVADKPADFAIDTDADALLTRVSGAVSNVILRLASRKTTHKTKQGLPLVTTQDVRDSAAALAQALGDIEGRDDVPLEAKEALVEMRRIAEKLAASATNAPR